MAGGLSRCGRRHAWMLRVMVLFGAMMLAPFAIVPAYAQSVAVEDMMVRQLEIQERMDELADIENPTPEQQSEMERLVGEWEDLENKIKTAMKSEPKATPGPKARPRSTPAPRVNPPVTVPAQTPENNVEKAKPTPRPRRNVGQRSGANNRINRNIPQPAATTRPAKGEVELSTELNELANNLGKPYDQREYEFAIVNGTYAELIEAFARMSGLEVIGSAPDGTISFTSKSKMDFKTALGRIQMLLFEHPQKFWIQLRDMEREPYLDIARIAEGQRILEDHQIFATVQQYREKKLDDNDLALLQFTPEAGSIAEIEFLRDFMPDYVLISQKEGENALLVFGLVRDINKYLSLVEKFRVTIEDPRQIVIIPIENIAPSDALELLKQLMDGFGNVTGAPARVRRPGQASVAEAWAEKVTAIPFDDQGTLLVKAMPNKIEEIKRLLPFIDIAIESGEPVIVQLEHGSATDIITIVRSVMSAGGDGAASPQRPRRNRRNAKAPVPKTPQVYGGQELTMIDWAASNSIILLGTAEEVAEAKALIHRFDVPDDKDIVQVDLLHCDGTELSQQVTQIAQVLHPGSAARLSVTTSPGGGALILAGPLMEIEGAKAIIEKLDIAPVGPPEDVHVYELKHVQPTQVVNILNSWDATETGAPTPTTPRARSKRRRTANATGAKFLPDDMRGVIYVVCTQEEWTERYQPVIAQLDQELEAPEFELVPLTHIEPEEAVRQITLMFSASGGKGAGPNAAAPKCVAVPEGIMVLDASEAQLASITTLIEQIDVDLIATGQRQKRTFDLAYVDPAEVIERLKELVASPAVARKGQPAAPTNANDVLFINNRDSVIVWAPTRQMSEIAELIEQLDAPIDANILKSYAFQPGVDVTQLADLLTKFFEESAPVAVPQAAAPPNNRAARRRRAARAAATPAAGAGPEVLFIPQPASRRIVVSAPPDMFEEIESTIEMLRPDGPNADAKVLVQFYDVEHGDAEAIARMVEPIIQVKLSQMIASNEITIAGESKVPSVKVSADAASSRIVAAAPALLMPDIQQMIERFDGGNYGKQITRRVQLTNAKAEDVVEVVKVMLSGGTSPTPVRRGRKAPNAPPGQPPAPVTASGENISVVPALSGDAVVLVGFEDQVDEVEGWIRQLDESTPDEYEIKVFRNLEVDVETLADEILTILDKPAPSKKAAKSEEEDDFFSDFDDFWDVGGPRCGSEICLTTNPYNNLLVVRTTTEKMRAVEQWVALYAPDPTSGEPPLQTISDDKRPKLILELKYADAYDAVYDLENLIDVIWSGDKPSIKKVPYENMLLIRAKSESDLEEVKALVAKYIDKDDGTRVGRVIRTTPVKGTSADLVLKRVMTRLDGMDVEIEEETSEGLLTVLKPKRCVLPSGVAIRAAELTSAAALLQAKVDEAEEKEQPPPEKKDGADKMLLDLLEKSGALTPTEEKSTESSDEKAAEAPVEKPKIRIDWRTNSIIVSGGSSSQVEEIEEIIDDAIRELVEETEGPPDIRVYQLEYIDPNIASQVLGAMFNVANRQQAGGRLTPQQLAAQRQQLQKQMQQQLKQQMQQRGGDEDEKAGKGEKGKEGGEEEPTPGGESSAQQAIRVFPYPALRALIVSAPTEMFPAIEELVATIDRKREVPPEYRFFPLKKQLASDVEQMLKIMLGLDEQSKSSARGGRNTDPAVQAVAEMMKAQLNLPVSGPEGEIVSSSESITITSNDTTNTVMAVAPVSVLDLIQEIIDDLEEQDIPPIETRKYDLKFANATVIVPMLEQLFAVSGRNQRGGSKSAGGSAYNPSEVSQYVSFHADESNNAVFVRGVARDFEKIEPVISELDIKTGGEVISFELTHARAEDMARSLSQVYENRGPRGGSASSRIHFVGDRASNTLFARLPDELVEEVSAKVKLMDRLAENRPKIVQLSFGNPRDIADTLERVYGGGRGGSDRVRISGDEATRQLLVVAPDELFAEIENTAKQMDRPEDLDVKIFKLNHAKASDVLAGMKQLVGDAMRMMSRTGGGSQMGPFAATADERTNSITVMGGPIAFATVEKVLKDIDVPVDEAGGGVSRTVRVMNLNYATADGVVRSLREIYRGGAIAVSTPQGSNALLILATDDEFEDIQKLVSELDVLPGEEDRSVRLITLKHTDVTEMQSIMESYLAKPAGTRSRGGQNLLGGIGVSAIESTNTLVVTGDDVAISRVAGLVDQIDVKVEAGVAPKFIKLENAVASEVESTITTMLSGGRGGGRGRNPSGGMTTVVVADDASNTLIVRATPADLVLIEEMARELDAGQKEGGSPVKLIALDAPHKAAELAPLVEATLRAAASSRSSSQNRRGTQVVVRAISASNSLMISGAPKDLELAQSVLTEIQSRGDGEVVRLITLDYADADSVVQSLREMFVWGRPGGSDIDVSSPRGTNSLLVRATEPQLAEVETLIKQLDVLPGDEDRTARMITLNHTNATEMLSIIEDYLAKPTGGRRGRGGDQDLVGGIRVSAIESTNSLVITGDQAGIDRVEALVTKIDVPVEGGTAPRIIKLANAVASEVEPTISAMFDSSAQGRNRRGGRGTQSGGMAPVIVADDGANALIVRATPADYQLIEDLTADLDQQQAESGDRFKLIQLASAYRAADLAPTVEAAMREATASRSSGRGGRRGGAGVAQLTVEPITASNSLLMTGDPKDLELAEAVVAMIQKQGPAGGKRTVILRPDNVSPEELERVINSMLQQNNSQGSRGSRSQPRRRR